MQARTRFLLDFFDLGALLADDGADGVGRARHFSLRHLSVVRRFYYWSRAVGGSYVACGMRIELWQRLALLEP